MNTILNSTICSPGASSTAMAALEAAVQCLAGGRAVITSGVPDGWPANDVPLVVMYSPDVRRLTETRRQMQTVGVRFLGYDRVETLLDALNVVSPAAVLVEENMDSEAIRVARSIQACDFTMPLVRVLTDSVQENDGRGFGPFIGTLHSGMQDSRLVAALGRLGVLPRRLLMVARRSAG